MKLIFDKDAILTNIKKSGYDNEKLPMGHLEPETIKQGYIILMEIEELVNRKGVENKEEALQYLSNRFYTYIPHKLGKNFRHSLIDSNSKIKAKNQLISSLIDIKTIMNNEKGKKPECPLDLNY